MGLEQRSNSLKGLALKLFQLACLFSGTHDFILIFFNVQMGKMDKRGLHEIKR